MGPQEALPQQEFQLREAGRPLPGVGGEQELQQLQSLHSISNHPGVFHPRQVSPGGCVPTVSVASCQLCSSSCGGCPASVGTQEPSISARSVLLRTMPDV